MSSAINSITHAKIKGFLEGFLQTKIDSYKNKNFKQPITAKEYLSRISKKGDLRPFHAAMLSPSLMRVSAFERGFSTSLGSTFEEAAKLIASQHHQEAHRNYALLAEVSSSGLAEIERQKERYDRAIQKNQTKPSFEEMLGEVMAACKSNDIEKKVVQADLYILTQHNQQLFFEIKAPKPNKGQCLEVLQRLLRFQLFQANSVNQVKTFYGMPYNPYGTLEKYNWIQAKTYLPFEDVVLVGDRFWSVLGGEGTYEALVEIYLEVGRELGKSMLDQLAFDF